MADISLKSLFYDQMYPLPYVFWVPHSKPWSHFVVRIKRCGSPAIQLVWWGLPSPLPSCTRPSSISSLSFVGSHAKKISLAPATLVYPRWNVFWENFGCYYPIEAKEWTGSQRRPWISNYFSGNRMFAYSHHTIFKTASLEVIINSQEVVMRIRKGPMDPSPSFSHW